MSSTKRVTPYARLKQQFHEWADKIVYPHRKLMWLYPKAKLNETWRLDDLAERVAAASQLGYAVELQNTDEGLRVVYVKARPTEIPWEPK